MENTFTKCRLYAGTLSACSHLIFPIASCSRCYHPYLGDVKYTLYGFFESTQQRQNPNLLHHHQITILVTS
jgi:hypothetical protein